MIHVDQATAKKAEDQTKLEAATQLELDSIYAQTAANLGATVSSLIKLVATVVPLNETVSPSSSAQQATREPLQARTPQNISPGSVRPKMTVHDK